MGSLFGGGGGGGLGSLFSMFGGGYSAGAKNTKRFLHLRNGY